jgi:hypothetical protein
VRLAAPQPARRGQSSTRPWALRPQSRSPLRLARYFKTTPQFWMNLQTSYELKIALRDSKGRIEKEVLPHAA